jgi:hydroxyacylglutathione hydrolase
MRILSSMLLMLVFTAGSIMTGYLPVAHSATKSVLEIKPAPKHDGIIFDQYYLACLSQASYLIGDTESKTAVLIDPERDIDNYMKDAEQQGLKITHVILTHVHADFVAGHIEAEKRTGAKICMGHKTTASFSFQALKEGDTIDLGKRLSLKILETPGHTTESISLLVYDKKKDSEKPYAVLTGDCLFIGDVGRPDLMSSYGVTAKELAAMEYDSLHNKLMALPDDTLVYPAHGAGSLCGKNLSSETVSSIGEQRKSNYALKEMTKEQFVDMITANQPKAPNYWKFERAINLNGHKALDEVMTNSLKPLSADNALLMRDKGAQILDAREMDDYADKHLANTINIALSGHYAFWAGQFLDNKTPIIVIADPGKEKQAIARLGRIGFDNVVGFVDGGIAAFASKPDLLQSNKRETATSLVGRLEKNNGAPLVVDIRNDGERKEIYIDGSLHVPLMVLLEQSDKLPKDRDIVVQCATGFRSSIAASLLRQRGFDKVTDLSGGITGWQAAKLPVKGSASCKAAVD